MRKILGLLTLLAFGQISIAQNHDAHVHGLADMTLVYEDQLLIIELETPAANMLGFEHSPHNADEWEKVQSLEDTVAKPELLFNLEPACELSSASIDIPFSSEEENDAHHHDEHDDDHDHDHDHEREHGDETHQDIHLAYQWVCEGDQSPQISVYIFDLFSGFEEINAQWVTASSQGASLLNKSNAVLELQQ